MVYLNQKTMGGVRRIPFLGLSPTNLENTYTSGSGVGAHSASTRRALIIRASLNKGTMKKPKTEKCSGFCVNGALQPPPGSHIPPPPPPTPQYGMPITYGQMWAGMDYAAKHHLSAINGVYLVDPTNNKPFIANFGSIENWDLSQVTSLQGLFSATHDSNGNPSSRGYMNQWPQLISGVIDITNWQVDHITNMNYMFAGNTIFNQDISSWTTSSVQKMTAMFDGATIFDQDLSTWNVGELSSATNMFLGTTALDLTYYNIQQLLDGNVVSADWVKYWLLPIPSPVTNVQLWVAIDHAAKYHLSTISMITLLDTNTDTYFLADFGNINTWILTQVSSFEALFSATENYDGKLLTRSYMNLWTKLGNNTVDITSWSTNNITDMDYMFAGNTIFNQDISVWDTSNVKKMTAMFDGATLMDYSLSIWNVTSVSPSTITNMFYGASALLHAFKGLIKNPVVADWLNYWLPPTNAPQTQGQLYAAIDHAATNNLERVSGVPLTDPITTTLFMADFGHIDHWDISLCNSCKGLFSATRNYAGTLVSRPHMNIWPNMKGGNISIKTNNQHWNTALIVDMEYMFAGSTIFNQDISNWDTSIVTDMVGMFQDATQMQYSLSNWIVTSVTSPITDMFLDASTLLHNFNLVHDPIVGAWLTYWTPLVDAPQTNGQLYAAIDYAAQNNKTEVLSTPLTDPITSIPFMANFGEINKWDLTQVTSFKGLFSATKDYKGDAAPRSYMNLNWSNLANNNVDIGTNWLVGSVGRQITNMTYMFTGNTIFNQDISTWNTSKVKSMESMFLDAHIFNNDGQDLAGNVSGQWNTSAVTAMNSMFEEAVAFDQDVNNWDTSKVKSMQSMFQDATAFNKDIRTWNTGDVTSMESMFQGAILYNNNAQNFLLSDAWTTSNVNSMQSMFQDAAAFNVTIEHWDTSKVTTMQSMFQDASGFNANISTWKTGEVQYMQSMFQGAIAFNQDISDWNTSNVQYMQSMFQDASGFNNGGQPLPQATGKWNTSNVTEIYSMFRGASSFNAENIYTWDTSKVTSMQSMFQGAIVFNRDIRAWNIGKVGTMEAMFQDASGFNNNGYHFNAGSPWSYTMVVTDMSGMFHGASSFNVVVTDWATNKVTTMYKMFKDAIIFNQDIDAWPTAEVTNMQSMFQNAQAFNNGGGSLISLITSKVETMESMFLKAFVFDSDISTWNTSKVTSMNSMFEEAHLFDKDISSWNTSQVRDMGGMFNTAYQFNNGGQPLPQATGKWNTSNVTTMNHMFTYSAFNQDISTWDTSKVQYMDYMFKNAHQFNNYGNSLPQATNKWNTSAVTTMSQMFNTAKVFDRDISSWNTSQVKSMDYMFQDAYKFNNDGYSLPQATNKWNTSNVTTMSGMFWSAEVFDQNISSWDTIKVTHMDYMFNNAYKFNNNDSSLPQATNKWNTSAVTTMSGMFDAAKVFDRDISSWNTSQVKSMYYMFQDAYKFNNDGQSLPQATGKWNTSAVTTMSGMFNQAHIFNQDIHTWDTGNVQSMDFMFGAAWYFNNGGEAMPGNVTGEWNTSKVTNMSHMFYSDVYTGLFFGEYSAFNQDINTWDVSQVQSMESMFAYCARFNNGGGNGHGHGGGHPLDAWNTSKVTTMQSMFHTDIYFDQDISSWDTSKVQYMNSMFYSTPFFNNGGQSLPGNVTGKWNTSAVTTMNSMFQNYPVEIGGELDFSLFDQDISSWDTSNVTDMGQMFDNAGGGDGGEGFNNDSVPLVTTAGGWNTSAVTEMRKMFRYAHNFNHSLSTWDVTQSSNDPITDMFIHANTILDAYSSGTPLIASPVIGDWADYW